MPLIHGKRARTREGFSENVSKEVHSGKPLKQALAISYSEVRRSRRKHYAQGGRISREKEICT